MAEQLSMDFAASTQPPKSTEVEQESYEPLDTQLASLFQELNGEPNSTLKHCTLEISKHTREGQIVIPVTEQQQAELLQTKVVGEAGDYMPLIIDQGYLYLRRYWQYQQRLADQIQARMLEEASDSTDEKHQDWAQKRLDVYFEDEGLPVNWQKVAASRALESRFLIISGGPGTGKTTTITRILALLIEQRIDSQKSPMQTTQIRDRIIHKTDEKSLKKGGGVLLEPLNDVNRPLKILLAAPTGKAAIRMLDSIRLETNALKAKLGLSDELLQQMPTEASTIHKMLGYQRGSVQFKHNRNNHLNADVVLVDEASMIDIALMSKLVEAVPPHAKLILIGDKDQLSSVETGSVFSDICHALDPLSTLVTDGGDGRGEGEDLVTSLVTLRKNWRFAEDSDIGQLAIAANQGDSATLLSVLKDQGRTGCELIAPEAMRDADLIKPWTHYFEVLNNPASSHAQIFEAFNQYRILCALRRGLNGSSSMSSRIETALGKQDLIKLRKQYLNQQQSQSWYHGRPIMITQNSYSKGLFNGDTGITLINEGKVKVWFPTEEGQYKSFSLVRLPAHETTWAMTIHKSQGSEFDQVALILPHEVMPLLTRQLIYTGITRAKQKVDIVASEAVLVAGVKAEVVKATRIDNHLKSGHK